MVPEYVEPFSRNNGTFIRGEVDLIWKSFKQNWEFYSKASRASDYREAFSHHWEGFFRQKDFLFLDLRFILLRLVVLCEFSLDFLGSVA